MTAVVRPRHILTVRLVAIHRGPLPSPRRIHPLLVLRSSTGEDLIPWTLVQTARLHRTGGGSSSSDSAVDGPSQARGASFAPPTSGVAPPPGPIPLPTVVPFTLPAIKNATDYLQTRDLILYWLRRPGYSTARSDSTLVTDSRNALAFEGQWGRPVPFREYQYNVL